MSNTLTFKEIKRKPGLYRWTRSNVWFITIYSPWAKTKHHTFYLSDGYELELAESFWDSEGFTRVIIGDDSCSINIPDVAQIIKEYEKGGL